MFAAFLAAANQAGFLENPQMLRDRGEGHRKGPGQLGDRRLAEGESRQNLRR